MLCRGPGIRLLVLPLLLLSVASLSSAAGEVPATALYLHAWWPELGPLHPPVGSVDRELLKSADLALRGHFDDAEHLLDTLAATPPDTRAELLIGVFRAELDDRRYELVGGSKLFTGDGAYDRLRREAGASAQARQFDRAVSGLPEKQRTDLAALGMLHTVAPLELRAAPEQLWSQQVLARMAPSSSIFTLAQIRETQRTGPVNLLFLHVADLEKSGLLSAVEAKLLRLHGQALNAQLAGDTASAQRCYKEAAQAARAALNHEGAVTSDLRLGDLSLLPLGGSPLALGYHVSALQGLRNALSLDQAVNWGIWPSRAQLDEATACYDQAEKDLAAAPSRQGRLQLAFRRALAARLRNQPQEAVKLYRGIVADAGDEYLIEGACARAAISQLTGELAPLSEGLATLTRSGALGAALSLVELAHTASLYDWDYNRDAWGATRRLRALAGTLWQQDLLRSRVDVLYTVSDICRATGRNDASLSALRDALETQKAFIAKLKALKVPSEASLMPVFGVPSAVRTEEQQYASLLLRMAWLLDAMWSGEPSLRPRWAAEAAAVDQELLVCEKRKLIDKQTAALVERSRKATAANRRLMQLEQSSYTPPPGLLARCEKLRPELEQIGEPALLLRLDAVAAATGPEGLARFRDRLQRTEPVSRFRAAAEEWGREDAFKTRADFSLAFSSCQFALNTAYNRRCYDIAGAWLTEMHAVCSSNPRLNSYLRQVEAMQASVLTADRQLPEAQALLRRLLDKSVPWSQASQPDRCRLLAAQLECDALLATAASPSVTGPEAQRLLLALETLRFEDESWRIYSEAMTPLTRGKAELVMLERKLSLGLGLTEEEQKSYQHLLQQDATGDLSTRAMPTPELLQQMLQTLPDDATTLVYYPLPEFVLVWRLEPRTPPAMWRLDTTASQLSGLVTSLNRLAAANEAGWEVPAQELTRRLLTPVGDLAEGRPLVILAAGPVAAIPFEVLGVSPDKLLLSAHPCAYASRLLGAPHAATGPMPVYKPAVVIGPAGRAEAGATAAEAAAVAKLLETEPVAEGKVSGEAILKRLRAARWVHIASDTTLDFENPYLTSLALPDGGRICFWELLRDAPRLDMLVLSSCHTGATAPTTSGGLSLVHPLIADTRMVLASRWVAPDAATADLMQDFYTGICRQQRTPLEALWSAQKTLAARDASPCGWASFALTVSDPTVLSH